MNKRKFGTVGEKIAEKYLKNEKYKIICKNFFTRKGEIDIVAQKGKNLVFVEVKTRSNYNYGSPSMAINATKIKHMKIAAGIFLELNRFNKYNIRFDVIEIIINNGKCEINHIKQII